MEITFPRSKKPLEFRIALLPKDVKKIKNPQNLYFEKGYGEHLGISDKDYLEAGANICMEQEVYSKETFCQPRFHYNDLPFLKKEQTVFGFLHLVKDDIDTGELIEKQMTAIAWEFMFKRGKFVFQRNMELTGQLGVRQSMTYSLINPRESTVAVIGDGRVGSSAIKELRKLRVKEIYVYNSKNSHQLKNELELFDAVINCSNAKEDFLSQKDLKKLKKGAFVADLSCQGIEGLEAMPLFSPVYTINEGRNRVYKVNNLPSLQPVTASRCISEDVVPYIDMLVKEELDDALKNAIVINQGIPVNDKLE